MLPKERPPHKDHWLFHDDIAAVALKVGQTPEARLRWVLDFADHSNYAAWPAEETPVDPAREVSMFLLYQMGPGVYDKSTMPHLQPAVLGMLAKEIDDGLNAYVDKKPWESRHVPVVDWVLRGVRAGSDGNARNLWRAAKHGRPVSEGLPLMMVFAVMDLLQTDGWRLARCARANCDRRFVRKDQRQNYCSARCSQTTRTQRLRTKPEREKVKP